MLLYLRLPREEAIAALAGQPYAQVGPSSESGWTPVLMDDFCAEACAPSQIAVDDDFLEFEELRLIVRDGEESAEYR